MTPDSRVVESYQVDLPPVYRARIASSRNRITLSRNELARTFSFDPAVAGPLKEPSFGRIDYINSTSRHALVLATPWPSLW